jgi:hypothetical protein
MAYPFPYRVRSEQDAYEQRAVLIAEEYGFYYSLRCNSAQAAPKVTLRASLNVILLNDGCLG